MSVKLAKLQVELLKLQLHRLKFHFERQRRRDAFIKKHLAKIRVLSMDGWPKTRNMKDYPKWLDIVYQAKIEGIYSLNTANCDVIAQLNRFAKIRKQ